MTCVRIWYRYSTMDRGCVLYSVDVINWNIWSGKKKVRRLTLCGGIKVHQYSILTWTDCVYMLVSQLLEICVCFCNVELYWKDNLCFCAIPDKNSRLITWFSGNLILRGHWWQIPSWEALAAAAHILLKGHLGPLPISSQNSIQYLLTVDKAILHAAIYLTSRSIFRCININGRKLINSVWFQAVFCKKKKDIFYSVLEIKTACYLFHMRDWTLSTPHTHTHTEIQACKQTPKQPCRVSSKTSIMYD